MTITEVRIKLVEDREEHLLACCSITFDRAFVVRDLKIIQGTKGCFVSMPSRKLTDRCPQCGFKNHLRARFCNQCGCRLDGDRAARDAKGRAKLHADVAHPINTECRGVIQDAVLKAYVEEKERAQHPGYVSRDDDYDTGDADNTSLPTDAGVKGTQAPVGHTRTNPTVNRVHGHGHIPANPREEQPHNPNFGAGILD